MMSPFVLEGDKSASIVSGDVRAVSLLVSAFCWYSVFELMFACASTCGHNGVLSCDVSAEPMEKGKKVAQIN